MRERNRAIRIPFTLHTKRRDAQEREGKRKKCFIILNSVIVHMNVEV